MIYVAADEERGLPARFEMYDLEADPGELVNVFDERVGERPGWRDSLLALHEIYAAQRGEAQLDPERLEKLKALGYMEHQ